MVKITDIGLKQSDYVKDDCSTPKLLCFLLIIGDFTTYENEALSILSLFFSLQLAFGVMQWEPGLKARLNSEISCTKLLSNSLIFLVSAKYYIRI